MHSGKTERTLESTGERITSLSSNWAMGTTSGTTGRTLGTTGERITGLSSKGTPEAKEEKIIVDLSLLLLKL